MPAFTPRAYPYPVDSDPADVPAATQGLAEAVDGDVQGLYDAVRLRPAAKAWSTVPYKIAPANSGIAYLLPLDSFQFNVSDACVLVNRGRIIPQLPGFWWVMGSISIPKPSGTVVPVGVCVSMFVSGLSVIGRSGVNGTTLAADGSSELVASGGSYFNGTTDFLDLAVEVTASATVPTFTVLTRALTLIRMTTV